jgi:hypothetical protein
MAELKAEVLQKKAEMSRTSGAQRSLDRINISSSSSDKEEQDFYFVENFQASKDGAQSGVSKAGGDPLEVRRTVNDQASAKEGGSAKGAAKDKLAKLDSGGTKKSASRGAAPNSAPPTAGRKDKVKVSKGSNSGAAPKCSDGAAPGAAHSNASSRKPVHTWQLPGHSGAAKFGPCVLGGFCSDHCVPRKQKEKEGQAEQSDRKKEPNITSDGSNSRAAPEFATTGATKTNQAEEGIVKQKECKQRHKATVAAETPEETSVTQPK